MGFSGVEECCNFVTFKFFNRTSMPHPMNALLIPITGRTMMALDNIVYVEGDRNYTILYLLNGDKMLLSFTMATALSKLPTDRFIRISKRHAVNVTYLRMVSLHAYNRHVKLSTGQLLPITRRRVSYVKRFAA
jgi:DNA-binding LytR/AlgR family response regulator